MKKFLFTLLALSIIPAYMSAKTLVVYYSYTNNVETIVNELKTQIECDVVEIEPAEKGLDYAANNYAIGSAQIAAIKNNPTSASSYPAIDPVTVNLDEYDTIIVGAPLWWSQMAAPLQTYLFNNGAKMAGKNIGVIVSSHSSLISGVVADAKRLIPNGHFLEPSLWIRSAQTSNAGSLISKWLLDIKYKEISEAIQIGADTATEMLTVYNIGGEEVAKISSNEITSMNTGIYIVKGDISSKPRKIIVAK